MGITDFENASFPLVEEEFVGRRTRRSAMASGENLTVQHDSVNLFKFKLMTEGISEYLLADEGNITVGPFDEIKSCFRVHQFQTLENVSTVIVLESHNEETLVGDSSGNVSLMESNNIQGAQMTDERFFQLERDGVDFKIKHLQTGKFLSAEDSTNVSLVSSNNITTDEMLFDMIECESTNH